MDAFTKLGEAQSISAENILSVDQALGNDELLERFTKLARDLKAVAPKADDFLYFTANIITSAERSLYDDNGQLRKDAHGNPVEVHWERSGKSWKWVCSDPGIKPYKNANCDIFPESEIIAAHKKWIGKPLCIDHKSSSIDGVRGIIVDTYYDYPNKRVVALCALDKKNYPDLARKVKTGYSNSVSMGVGVSQAVCTDCGTVAVCEADFCDCMRNKRCYGEINVGLNPIELSIVVTPADPSAKIRHIVAAVNAQKKYLDMKKQEFSKKAEDEKEDIALATKLTDGISAIVSELEALKDEASKLKANEEKEQQKYEETKKSSEMDSADSADTAAVPQVQAALNHLNSQLEKISEKINKLNLREDNDMTTKNAYFQGTEEPTPGKPRYVKEEADAIRNTQDKNMVGQMNTGPVDGMHPGYASYNETEENRKKRLLRAQREERKMRRYALLNDMQKEAYFQGTEEPTPGKPQYAKEDADKIRNTMDKNMVGQSPFPNVGDVEGLHPSPESAEISDELKRKQMLARAKLQASFKKAANADGTQNKATSRWNVEADGQLVLTATVSDIVGAGKVDVLYENIATKDFGRKLLAMIKEDGIEKTAARFSKEAQEAPMAPVAPAAPAAPPPVNTLSEEAPKDTGGNGDVAKSLPEILDNLENDVADARKALDAMGDKSGNDLADLEPMAAAGELPPSMASNLQAQKKLHRALEAAFKSAKSELTSLATELKLAQAVLNSRPGDATVQSLAQDVVDEARRANAQFRNVKVAFVNYCRGAESLNKKAHKYLELNVKTAQTANKQTLHDPLAGLGPEYGEQFDIHAPAPAKPEAGAGSAYTAPKKPAPAPKPVPAVKPSASDEIEALKKQRGDRSELESMLINNTREMAQSGNFQTPQAPRPSGQNQADDCDMAKDCGVKDDENELKVAPDGTMEGSAEEVGKAMKAKSASQFDMSTKEGRAAFRADLMATAAEKAEKADKGSKIQYSDTLSKAHKGGFSTKLDIKPSGDLAVVETLEETQKAMLEIAKAPPKVRQAAEEIQRLVIAGHINPQTDFDSLVAEGLDKDAVSYWKAFWGQAKDGGSQFATELVKERAAKKAAEENEAYRIKLARAYELTYEMVGSGECPNEKNAINTQVNELMTFSDEGFNSFKRAMARRSVVKTAGVMPQVTGAGDIYLPTPAAAETDLATQLNAAFSKSKGRSF